MTNASRHLLLLLLLPLLLLTSCEPDSFTPAGSEAGIDLRRAFDDVLPLPDGFKPEGIVAGTGNDYYVGSLADGSIFRGDFRTGAGGVFFAPDGGGQAVGLGFDNSTKYLYVAGGGTGGAYVVDTRSGSLVTSFAFGGGFVNDVIVTKNAAYFTDSAIPQLYVVELDRRGRPTGTVETLPLSGDFQFEPGQFNANGIEATPNGDALFVVNTFFGTLYFVDPATGVADEVEDVFVPNGDGILLRGKTLFVVQNFRNQIAEVSLSSDYRSGRVTDVLTDPDFRIPTTVTSMGGTLYAVNARFDVAPPPAPAPNTEFEVVRVDR